MIRLYLHKGKISWLKQPALKLIQVGTDSPYFHVDAEYDKRFFIGATAERGVDVRQKKWLYESGHDIDIFECLAPIDEEKFYDLMASREGGKYDLKGVFYLGWLKISGQRDKANKWQKGNDYFCSEFVMSCLLDSVKEPNWFQDIPENDIASPADIARSRSFKLSDSIEKQDQKSPV